ncbi:response regulator [Halanaerobacter jeridensis]|uniref:Stage 0 sporulation protein A homolog n=1 Tax=Halanaerobacter jeridensis TaxID=706427 RepID=A0A938XQ87_9FIRM|nr:response regulator transcription factor [Halanaerobacter jeridensis]MBM7555451.1 phosphate regulon transcriptional regulator PhoB [Halanaerobacter jeridensis]
MGNKILVVDDEENIVKLVSYNLEQEGYEIITANEGKEALAKIEQENPDLMILDLMLPKVDGFDICRKVRKDGNTNNLPIIILSAKEEEIDKILGLELGADDYVTKPFSPRELIARVKAVLRRVDYTADEEKQEVLKTGAVELDLKKHQVRINDKEINLTPKEFELLSILIKHPGQVFSRDNLLGEIWDYNYHGDTRTVDVHVRRLRKKISEYSEQKHIITVRGVGYKFKED